MTLKQAKSLKPNTKVIITKKSESYYAGFTIGKVYKIEGLDGDHFEFNKDDNGFFNTWPVYDCELYGKLTKLLYGRIKWLTTICM